MGLFRRLSLLPLRMLEGISTIYASFLAKVADERPNFWLERQSKRNDLVSTEVNHKNGSGEVRLTLFTPNWLCWSRSKTFSSKEPDTLKWIDELGGNGAFFDIGANVGLYSLYYAKTKSQNVYAFEPSTFNLSILARNIYSNGLESKIIIVPIPLSDTIKIENFILTSTEIGNAHSAFGVCYDEDGLPIERDTVRLAYRLPGLSLDAMLDFKLIEEVPSLIKIDVDGIEDLILSGASRTLRHPKCTSVLVETSKKFESQRIGIETALLSAGFRKDTTKFASLSIDRSRNINQIWLK